MAFTGKLGTALSKPGQLKLANASGNSFNNSITFASTVGFSLSNVIQFSPDSLIFNSITVFSLFELKIFTAVLGTKYSKPIRFKLATPGPHIYSNSDIETSITGFNIANNIDFGITLSIVSTATLILDQGYIAEVNTIFAVTSLQTSSIIADDVPSINFTSTGFINRDISQGYNPILTLSALTNVTESVQANENPSFTIAGNSTTTENLIGTMYSSLTMASVTSSNVNTSQTLFVNLNLQSNNDFLFFKIFDLVTLPAISGFSGQAITFIPKSLIIPSITGLAPETQLSSNINFSISSITNFDGIDGPSEVVFLQGRANLAIDCSVQLDPSIELIIFNTKFNIIVESVINPLIIIQGFPHFTNVALSYIIGGVELIAGSASISVNGSPEFFPALRINSKTGIPVNCIANFVTSLGVNSTSTLVESIINPFSTSISLPSIVNLSIDGFVAHFNNLSIATASNLNVAIGSIVDANFTLNVFQSFTGTFNGVYNITFKPGSDSDSATKLFFLNLGDFKLRPPTFGNEDKLEISRINRKTRNGTLRMFRQPYWPVTQTFHWEIEGLKEVDAKKAVSVFEASLGQDIIITDFEGRKIKGLVLTPLADIIQHGTNDDFHITLDFEGQFIP